MNRKTLYHIIEWSVAVAACGWLVWKLATYDDYAGLWVCLQGMGWRQWLAIALCIALMPVNMAIEAWRWKTLAFANRCAKVHTAPLNEQATDASAPPTGSTPLAPVGDPFNMSWHEAQRQVYYSKLAGLITPWRLGEYPARALLMNEGEPTSDKVLRTTIGSPIEQSSSPVKGRENSKPILLLDDIFDRLDSERVERIVEMVQGDNFGQIFITDTDRQHLTDILKPSENARIFHVEGGVIN